jgi:hypothetical protein
VERSRTPLRGAAKIDLDIGSAKLQDHRAVNGAFRAEGFNIGDTPNFVLLTNGDWVYIGLPDSNAIMGTFINNREFQLSRELTL